MRRLFRAMAVVVLTSLFATPAQAATLVAKGKATATIVTSDKPNRSVRYAAEELQLHVEKAGGVKLEVLPASRVEEEPGRTLVLVGPSRFTEAMGIDPKAFPPEGYLVKATDFRLVLIGNDDPPVFQSGKRKRVMDDPLYIMSRPGTLFAVYAFLDREMGVKWLWPGELGTVVPRREVVRVDRCHYVDAPRLIKRHVRWIFDSKKVQSLMLKAGYDKETVERINGEFNVWYRRHMLGWRYIIDAGHAFTHYWDKYHEQHPDWFAMRPDGGRYIMSDGERRTVKLCVSNPVLVDQVYKDGVAKLERSPYLLSFSASPNDGHGYCMCPDCKAMDHPDGPGMTFTYKLKDKREVQVKWVGMADRYAKFWDTLADRLAKDYPDRYLGVYAYAAYRYPPLSVGLRPNILLGFVGFNRYVGQLDHSGSRKGWLKWAETGCRQFLRPNSLYFSGHGFPYMFARQIASDTKFCAQRGMLGTDFDSWMGHHGTQGPNIYALVRIIGDPTRDVESCVDEFCYGGFGKAGAAIKTYFDRCEQVTRRAAEVTWPDSRSEKYAFHGRLFDRNFFDDARVLLFRARRMEDDPTIRKRIDFLETGLEYAEVQAACLVKNFEMSFEGKDPAGALAAIGAKEKFMEEHRNSWAVFVPGLRYTEWMPQMKSFFGITAYEGLKDKNVFAVLPKWKFRLDPEKAGDEEGWWKPGYEDREWPDIRAGKWWEPQGYGGGPQKTDLKGGYNGIAWYRCRVDIPQDLKSKKIFLRFGGIDESGWVYFNGEKVGETVFDIEKNPWSYTTPVVCDVTRLVRFDGPNAIAVKVEDRNGAGGLWRLVSLYWE